MCFKQTSHTLACLAALVVATALVGCAGPRSASVHEKPRQTKLAIKHNRAGLKHMDAADYIKAQKAFSAAVNADDVLGETHNNLGVAYYHQDRLYPAAESLLRATELMPDRGEPQNNLGMVYEDAGKLDQAIDHYDAAHQLDTHNIIFLGNLVRARVRRGDREKDLEDQMTQLLLHETRADWRTWVREQLARRGHAIPDE